MHLLLKNAYLDRLNSFTKLTRFQILSCRSYMLFLCHYRMERFEGPRMGVVSPIHMFRASVNILVCVYLIEAVACASGYDAFPHLRRNVCVGGDNTEHCGHIRMDHARAFGNASHSHCGACNLCLQSKEFSVSSIPFVIFKVVSCWYSMRQSCKPHEKSAAPNNLNLHSTRVENSEVQNAPNLLKANMRPSTAFLYWSGIIVLKAFWGISWPMVLFRPSEPLSNCAWKWTIVQGRGKGEGKEERLSRPRASALIMAEDKSYVYNWS